MFETPVTEQGGVMIVAKSYRGSREALIHAAVGMKYDSPRFGPSAGSETPIHLAAIEGEPAVVVAAKTFKAGSG